MRSFEQKVDNPPALPKPSFGASSARLSRASGRK
jgi:hypothetical protein